ncbi:thiopeptide-type bacteriocin biosynthesis protein [Chryseobacterium paridis]|uniref:Thiopeptide-type bacteriocin biosynthesis protein n=1 Tax=Chryseobacterium paridis TaxID=2800328 RepID=A0ABS1FUQ9_9FLAO|nr:thiopeptide-type bacteriocin biosynthesis protein [Chryseobacterium paridis]MBK1896146.1 thiopeptide-type bacteriocin biosynthesis protein [Chryseobacterium paridis]
MVKRKFIFGSEWVYLKISTGIIISDVILNLLKPLIKSFQDENITSKWFFIRYNVPRSHIRIRFQLNEVHFFHTVIYNINAVLNKHIHSGEILNIQIDTYNREIERYGEGTIGDAETLFQKNSEFTLQCLHYNDEEKIIISLFYIDEILNNLNLSLKEKLVWIKDFNTAFKREFNADKKLNSQLDKKYREFQPKYLDFLQSEEFLEERNSVISNIKESYLALQNIIKHHETQSLGISIQSFFQSIFHMNINRLFISNQRLFEMVIYDYLARYYKTKLYNNKH